MTILIWYLILTPVPHSAITYPKPIGPFTAQECRKAWAAVTAMRWSELASIECKRAVRFEVCSNPDIRSTTPGCCCPVFEVH